MKPYEISYRENGTLKNKGFSYKADFEKFLNRISKKTNITEIRTFAARGDI